MVVWRAWGVALTQRYKESWFDKHFRFSAPVAVLLFLGSLVINTLATAYATERASNYVEDIILSNTPAYDMSWFFVYGLLFMVAFIMLLCLWHPRRIPFILHSLTLFMLIRSAFVSLTHLGPFPIQDTGDFGNIITKLFFSSDLFFSGHTGAPFLMALMFWHEKNLRYIFLSLSIFFGIIVLLGHYHYTIDVLSAFFITYGIYHIALWLFPKDRALFLLSN